jgi:hypothetical protein
MDRKESGVISGFAAEFLCSFLSGRDENDFFATVRAFHGSSFKRVSVRPLSGVERFGTVSVECLFVLEGDLPHNGIGDTRDGLDFFGLEILHHSASHSPLFRCYVQVRHVFSFSGWFGLHLSSGCHLGQVILTFVVIFKNRVESGPDGFQSHHFGVGFDALIAGVESGALGVLCSSTCILYALLIRRLNAFHCLWLKNEARVLSMICFLWLVI